jgi:hypothetical protein
MSRQTPVASLLSQSTRAYVRPSPPNDGDEAPLIASYEPATRRNSKFIKAARGTTFMLVFNCERVVSPLHKYSDRITRTLKPRGDDDDGLPKRGIDHPDVDWPSFADQPTVVRPVD